MKLTTTTAIVFLTIAGTLSLLSARSSLPAAKCVIQKIKSISDTSAKSGTYCVHLEVDSVRDEMACFYIGASDARSARRSALRYAIDEQEKGKCVLSDQSDLADL